MRVARWTGLVVVLVLAGFLATPISGAAESPTGYEVAPQFQALYSQSGGLPIFGYALGPETAQADGVSMQYFERQRLEYHPNLAGTPYAIELGRLGAADAAQRGLTNTAPFRPVSAASNANCDFFPATGHRVCFGFLDFWRTHGLALGSGSSAYQRSLALFGYPISEEFVDSSTGLTTQYFERAVFEYHPELQASGTPVLLGAIGRRAMAQDNQAFLSANKAPAATGGSAAGSGTMLFGVYPGGGNGEVGYVTPPSPDAIVAKINALRGTRPFNVHLYTAWSWYDPATLEADIARYTGAGYSVTLTVKYSPPAGHVGDISGFTTFVRQIVDRYGTNPSIVGFDIGNEINNVSGNPGSSDGPIANVQPAVVSGVIAARDELNRLHTPARVGTDIAVLSGEADAQFLSQLTQLGGNRFRSALGFVGINVYPGLWPVGTGNPYQDMATYLGETRAALSAAGLGSGVAIDVLESGYPTLDESLQASHLGSLVQAVCDNATRDGVSSYSWFDLWDANSASTSIYDHYGLLHSDLSVKPAFTAYQQAIARGCSAGG
ncbi:MAG TPA: hypothetical protein VFN57_12680 [Thermomicrobiaceae bacterium]|nr:hypothetical protein [Thermomicrobiaceae bacterium]